MTSGQYAPGGDPGSRGGPPGGLPPQRLDQLYRPPPPMLAPGAASGTFKGRQVIILGSGPGSGLFVYNGAEALGNLIAQIVAPGTTVDPVGNSVQAVFNVGHWNPDGSNGAHFGIDAAGNLYLVDATPTIRGYESPVLAAKLIYDSGGFALNHLMASMASAPATDPHGNAFLGGFAVYIPGTPASAAQLSAGSLSWWNAASGSGGPWTQNGPQLLQSNGLQISSGTAGGGTAAGLNMADKSPNGVSAFTGSLGFLEQAAPLASLTHSAPQLYASNASGMVRMVSDTGPGATGDGQQYNLAEADYWNTAAVAIPASGFTTVFSQPVAALTYFFEGKMRLKQGGTGSIPGNIGFTGPATSFGLWDAFTTLQGTTTVQSTTTLGFTTQLNVLGAQTVANDEVVTYFDGIVTFTAAGTFVLGCQADGTHPFTAQPGCKLRLRPIG